MKMWLVVFAAGLVLAAVAFLADSPLLLMLGVLTFGVVVLGMFVLGVRVARQKGCVRMYLVTLAAGLVVAAVAVTAIVDGAFHDAPGLVLLGIALIVSDLVGLFTVGLRGASCD